MSGEGWIETPFGDMVEFHDRRRVPLSRKERIERQGPYPYYGASGVIDYIEDYIFEGRYLLIAEDGENLNSRKVPIAFTATGQFWVNNHAHIVRALPGVADDDFLRAYVENHPLNGFITGAAQPKLSQASLKRLPVLAPPYESQRQIGRVIRTLDDLIDNTRRRIEVLEEMAWLIYREWFVHFRFPGHEDVELVDSELGPIPKGWGLATLGSLATWLSGGTPSTKDPRYWDGEIPWIASGSLTSFILVDSERKLTPEGVEAGSRVVDRDTLLIVVRGMSLAKEFRHGIADVPLAFGQDCKALVTRDNVEPLFLAFAVADRATEIQQMVEFAAHGTGKLSTDRLQALTLALPPTDTQRAFDDRVRPMRELMSNLVQQIGQLRKIRDMLLPRLVSGELDVSEFDLDLEPVG